MAIKKAYQDIINFLNSNLDSTVGDVIDQVTAMAEAKRGGERTATISHRDEDGKLIAVLDYYFKKWLPVEFVEFGKKASSATGLNNMCKLGVSHWTKRERDAKKAKEELMTAMLAGDINIEEAQAEQNKIDEAKHEVLDFPIPEFAFDNVEDLLASYDTFEQVVLDNTPVEEAA